MEMLYIKISPCFAYHFQKCMPTNHSNAYNKSVIGFPQRGKGATGVFRRFGNVFFLPDKNGLCATFIASIPDLHFLQRFYLNKLMLRSPR